MNTFLIASGAVVVLVFVTRFGMGKRRTRELDRDFSVELACSRSRALLTAATAARGVLWEVEFTDNGLRTKHIRARNVVHVAISDLPDRHGRSVAKVWTRYALTDAVLIQRPRSYTDTRRKRDKIIRALTAHAAPRPRDVKIR
ncbi:hypothetical protein [Actinophytocola algeriensis]|jgi:hypothetical protein|uniref:Uncharacterized protein n=1 Tax=Actinophytocola algeriensis TaxID=1768010 RepID=A0A7W7Q4F3_9PSEU|nr:hypothetical protein [Actinophytocola algeriensis]MBB4906876.1 hypothetical protein [Actinophytocola algeriensis]MBE1478357.1 hypothetical protein [Actinophytocola algeriensis]